MNNFKSIWNQLECDSSKLETVFSTRTDSVFNKLEKEENLKKKFIPIQVILVAFMSILFGYIVYQNTVVVEWSTYVGIGLVTLASIVISIFPHIVKLPLSQFEHDKSSLDFLKLTKKKLDQSRQILVLGILLQIIFLSIGLYLIIFHSSANINLGYQYAFWGTMLGIGGAAIGGSFAFFSSHYKQTYQTINHFIEQQ